MGVLDLFSTLSRNDVTSSSIIKNAQMKTDADSFFIDFNSIVHIQSMELLGKLNTFLRLVLKTVYLKKNVNHPILTDLFTKYKMQDIQSQITPKTTAKEITRLFTEFFDEKKMDKLVITNVINAVIKLKNTYTKFDRLKTLFLAIDGVPSKGKMVEQRQRRYIGSFVEKYKKKILAFNESNLKREEFYLWEAESNPITWSKNKITPGTAFMHKLALYLRSDGIQEKIKHNNPKLNLIVSDMYEVGEGEKKIMNYIQKYYAGSDKNLLVYSPDADGVLLCMLLPNPNVAVLRQNPQESNYDIIDITILKKNIGTCVNDKKSNFDTNRINYDMVFVSTLFGNDFVPRIETINVKSCFENIIDVYLNVLAEGKKYLVNVPDKNNKKFTLNYAVLMAIIKGLLPLESDYIKHNDVYNTYVKARIIKNTFPQYEITMENIVSIVKEFKFAFGDFCNLIKNNQNYQRYEMDEEFMTSMRKCIRIMDSESNTQVNVTYLSDKELINLIRRKIRVEKEPIRLSINLDILSRSAEDRFHSMQIKKKESKLGRKLNSYEYQIYQFENMLDQYAVQFKAAPMPLGHKDITKYYDSYFGITPTTSKSAPNNIQLSKDGEKLMKDYVEGLLWVFEYYYNDKSYLNRWCYMHEKAPLLRHIYAWLQSHNQDNINSITKSLDQYVVKDLTTFFNPLEQLIYVSPMTKHMTELLPLNYREFVRSFKTNSFMNDYFVSVDDIVRRTWGKKVSTDIDCHGASYLTKCVLTDIHKPTVEQDQEFLKQIRKVKPSDASDRRSKNTLPPY